MTSRLDRLFSLLENCPNDSLRVTAARQLGELAQKAPEDVNVILLRLLSLLHNKSWRSRVAAVEAIRSMMTHLEPWVPSEMPLSSPSGKVDPSHSSSSSFLSLAGLNLDLVLENGARLYSTDLREFVKEKTSAAKLPRRTVGCNGTAAEAREARSSSSGEAFDRGELNRQLGLAGGDVLSSLLGTTTTASLGGLISDVDLCDPSEDSGSDTAENLESTNVLESVKLAYENIKLEPIPSAELNSPEASTSSLPSRSSSSSEAAHSVASGTDWPLNDMCVHLLGDLWDCRWETRHGAASALRELLAFPCHTRQAGARNGVSALLNRAANRIYLEDVVVRVLCTLALDQFSDFACDVVAAPVRQTAAQLLGVLCLHLDMAQIRLVVGHLLFLVRLLRQRQTKQTVGNKRTRTPKVNWMVVHGGLLGVNYVFSARIDLAKDLLPLVYGALTEVLFPRSQPQQQQQQQGGGSQASTVLNTTPLWVEGSFPADDPASAGEEDLRCAACNVLLALPCDLVVAQSNAVGHPLVDDVWRLLENSAGDLSPITGPLLTLASQLMQQQKTAVSKQDEEDAMLNGDESPMDPTEFAKRVVLVLRFLHHVSTEIRRTAVRTLDALLSISPAKMHQLFQPPLLECVLEQLFHRILLETDLKTIHGVCDLWKRLVADVPVDLLVPASLDRVDFWLCQAMQPATMPFSESMFRLLTAPTANQEGTTLTHNYHIGGLEVGTTNERSRQSCALETRITAVGLLAALCSRICEHWSAPITVALPSTSDSSTTTTTTAGESTSTNSASGSLSMSVAGYLLAHLVGGTHLRDRLGMQRFVGSLLLAAWPPSSVASVAAREDISQVPGRLTTCLTNVVYYEEILGLFKVMQDDCYRLRASCDATGLSSILPNNTPKSGSKVMNLMECQALLQTIGAELSRHKVPATSASGDSVTTTTTTTTHLKAFEVDELERALLRAQVSVQRCFSLQLFWSSRVELALSSALINFNWVTAGRLTPIIRPLMETIRGGSGGNNHQNSTPAAAADLDLPTPGECLRLQRLAAWNLARLLWNEFCQQQHQHQQQQPGTVGAGPNLKALSKVTQNLAKYILPDEIPEWDALISHTAEENAAKDLDEGTLSLTALLLRRLKSEEKSVDESASSSRRPQPASVLRRCGSLMALVALVQVFTSSSSSSFTTEKKGVEELMAQRLTTLWEMLCLEPLRLLGLASFDDAPVVLSQRISGKAKFSSAEIDALTHALYLLPPVLNALGPGPSPGLVAMATRCLRSLPTASSPPRLRYAAAHNLAVVAASNAQLTAVVLNSLLLPLVQPQKEAPSDAERLATLEALYHVIDCILTPRMENQVFQSLQLVGCDEPLSQRLHGIGVKEAAAAATAGLAQPSPPLQCLLAYVVVILTSLVLPYFADARCDVRLIVSSVFTKLLVLLPLEESAQNPTNPEIPEALRLARENGRHFVQCLLHPKDIQLYTPDPCIKAELRPYQQEGVNWLLFLKRYGLNGILADDLGLGKTLQTICALVAHHKELMSIKGKRQDGGISLVVCPATLCAHWLGEVTRFVQDRAILSPMVYAVSNLDQRNILKKTILSDCNLLITTYDMVRSDVAFFEEPFWEYLILDEGHIIKNSKSKIACAVKRLRARHRLMLTGTPVQNRVGEMWSLFDFLMPGFLAPSESAFNSRFGRPLAAAAAAAASTATTNAAKNGQLMLQQTGQQALEELHRIVMPFVLRRLKEEVLKELPPKVIQDYLCVMTPLQLKLYEAFCDTEEGQEALSLALKHSSGPVSTRQTRGGGFRSIRYLLAVCNHPALVLSPEHPLYQWAWERFGGLDGLGGYHLSGKLIALKQLLLDCGFSGGGSNAVNNSNNNKSSSLNEEADDDSNDLLRQHRALIFFQTKRMLNLVETLLKEEFPSLVHLRLDGSVPLEARTSLVERFNRDPSIDALLLTTAVGGLGLNLTGADTVIFVEHDWNPCRDLQAMDRAHRIGQRRVVSVYRLLSTRQGENTASAASGGTIEERIMSLQAFKQHLARSLVSQPANRALGEMDTSRLIDDMAKAAAAGAAASVERRGDEEEEQEMWSWTEDYEVAESDARQFLARLPRSG